MKVPKDYDVESGGIAASKGTDYCDNPGVMPNEKAVPMTPGEKGENPAAQFQQNKAQPFGKGGSGYTKNY